MANMQNFVSWFLQNLPGFLLSEPIIYFIGLAFLAFAVSLCLRFIRLR